MQMPIHVQFPVLNPNPTCEIIVRVSREMMPSSHLNNSMIMVSHLFIMAVENFVEIHVQTDIISVAVYENQNSFLSQTLRVPTMTLKSLKSYLLLIL